MIAVPTFQVIASLVIGLFLIALAKRLTAGSQNPVLVGVHDGLAFITS